ncbi:MAG TPA: diaminopimelate epimerase [Thermoanaerobaculia bacterium]|nr:diaminopimelate epimerase [Thermoanaerobaculia bacterium]
MTRAANPVPSSGSAPKRFLKMAGAGNDFVVFDDRDGALGSPDELARVITTRRLSVGGDGIILLRRSERASVRMVYHNADGSLADFCANGTRCAARAALLLGLAPAEMTIETGYAIVPARVEGESVTLTLPPPTEVEEARALRLRDGSTVRGAYLMVGVPHYVIFVDQGLWSMNIDALGHEIRHHADLPLGANVNFVLVTGANEISVRTWERGVEAETLACGSGVVASSFMSGRLGKASSPLRVLTRSGIALGVELRADEIRLTGDARVVYRGEMTDETVAGFDPEWVRNPTDGGPRT